MFFVFLFFHKNENKMKWKMKSFSKKMSSQFYNEEEEKILRPVISLQEHYSIVNQVKSNISTTDSTLKPL